MAPPSGDSAELFQQNEGTAAAPVGRLLCPDCAPTVPLKGRRGGEGRDPGRPVPLPTLYGTGQLVSQAASSATICIHSGAGPGLTLRLDAEPGVQCHPAGAHG